jgi:hypothetical protein
MKGKEPMMVIAIGIGKKRKGESMREDDDMEDMMEDKDEMGAGGMTRYAEGGSLKMVEKNGEKVPFFAADNKGKMMGGGMTYAKGGMTKSSGRDGCAIRGKTKGRMV